MAMRMDDIPERRENWAEAEFKSGAKIVITLKSGHVLVSDEPAGFAGGAGGENAGPTPTGFLVAAFAADIPVILQRIAREQAISLQSIGARVSIVWNPRGIAGLDGVEPTPFEAVSDIRIRTNASDSEIDALKIAYERRCPLYNLLRKSGCRMIENWRVEKASP
ncbi:MAG: hypothetical protein GEU87_17575 [Alphaproteobacteria bacterium]|nr:hypothetical protein [Alphaproteobacteria bacterium]